MSKNNNSERIRPKDLCLNLQKMNVDCNSVNNRSISESKVIHPRARPVLSDRNRELPVYSPNFIYDPRLNSHTKTKTILQQTSTGLDSNTEFENIVQTESYYIEDDPVLITNPGGILDGFWGCLKPVLNFFGNASTSFSTNPNINDDWIYPFESITDLVFRGAGSQGAVFSGKLAGQEIAVKKLHKPDDLDIQHLKGLNHPNVVRLIGICVESPCYCILMEYCPNGQLFDLIHKNDGCIVSPANLADWSTQIARGMHYLHSKKIIHRDLKSPNILIGLNFNLKISDFGNSKAATENSIQMSFAGTFAWMAPEVIRSEPCSYKVDVWSFGVLLWELLTGKVPYEGVDSTAIIWGVGSEKLCLPLPMTCPTELRVLIKRCCLPNPKDRPKFSEILAHLPMANQEFLSGYTPERFSELKQSWTKDIAVQFECLRSEGVTVHKLDDHLIKMRRNELKHAQDIRKHYLNKLERVDQLYQELEQLVSQTKYKQKKEKYQCAELKARAFYEGEPISSKCISMNVLPQKRFDGRKVVKCNACGTHSTLKLDSKGSFKEYQPYSGLKILYDATKELFTRSQLNLNLQQSHKRFCSADDINTPQTPDVNKSSSKKQGLNSSSGGFYQMKTMNVTKQVNRKKSYRFDSVSNLPGTITELTEDNFSGNTEEEFSKRESIIHQADSTTELAIVVRDSSPESVLNESTSRHNSRITESCSRDSLFMANSSKELEEVRIFDRLSPGPLVSNFSPVLRRSKAFRKQRPNQLNLDLNMAAVVAKADELDTRLEKCQNEDINDGITSSEIVREDTPTPAVRLRIPMGRTITMRKPSDNGLLAPTNKPITLETPRRRTKPHQIHPNEISNRSTGLSHATSTNTRSSSNIFTVASTSCPESTRTSADESIDDGFSIFPNDCRNSRIHMHTSMENLVYELGTNMRDSLSEREKKIRRFKKRMKALDGNSRSETQNSRRRRYRLHEEVHPKPSIDLDTILITEKLHPLSDIVKYRDYRDSFEEDNHTQRPRTYGAYDSEKKYLIDRNSLPETLLSAGQNISNDYSSIVEVDVELSDDNEDLPRDETLTDVHGSINEPNDSLMTNLFKREPGEGASMRMRGQAVGSSQRNKYQEVSTEVTQSLTKNSRLEILDVNRERTSAL